MSYYSDPVYWDKRYALNSHPYEWYVGYHELKDVLEKWMKLGSRVMIAGCGNSRLGEMLYDHSGYTDMTCVDFSEAPIGFMLRRRGRREGLNYLRSDLKELPMPSGTFDCVVDKATLDSCLCGADEAAVFRSAQRVLLEVSRVLKPGGLFLCLSHTQAEDRQLLYSEAFNWEVQVEKVDKEEGVGGLAEEYEGADYPHYFLYVCRKRR